MHEIPYDNLIEYISMLRAEYGEESVKALVEMKEMINDKDTECIIDFYIKEYSKEFHICDECFEKLVPVAHKEIHTELDIAAYETFTEWICECCNKKYY